MRTLTPALLAVTLSSSLLAQSNAIPGIDVRLHELAGFTAANRRGPAFPNGEVGCVVGHSFCNAGTTNVPWDSTDDVTGRMLDTYPKIAFLLARDTGDRIIQISGRSFAKHSGTPFNFSSGPCAPCTSAGGPFFYVGCSDTYGTGFNGSQISLGPTTEINPWLGTFDTVGSYFDRGDPSVGGAAAMDGVKSLSFTMTQTFDSVKNRMEVQESDLTPGGPFYTQAHVVIQGEPVANRGNNIRSQEVSINWGGVSWNSSMIGNSVEGSVLTHWNGATLAENGNGNDDGRFLVAVKVTGPVGGMYHYEYAVHNLDNSRAGATFRVPLAAGAAVGGVGFHDIDQDGSNDWAFANLGNEIVWSAPASNPHEWNTILNFWFDCDEAPSFGQVGIDQARPGPGGMTVLVDSQVPSGIPTATVTSIGSGCGDCTGSFYELFSDPTTFDLGDTAIQLVPNATGGYDVKPSGLAYVFPNGTDLPLGINAETNVGLPFSLPYPGGTTTNLVVCSNGFISPAASNGTNGFPSTAEFHNGAARWAASWHNYDPALNGRINVMSSPTEVRVSFRNLFPSFGSGRDNFQYVFLPDGTVHYIYRNMTAAGFNKLAGWTPGNSTDSGSIDLSTAVPTQFRLCQTDVDSLALSASDRPVLGTTIQLVTDQIAPNSTSGVVMVSFTQTTPAIDLSIIGMEGCFLHGAGNGPTYPFNPASPSASIAFLVPNVAGLTGTTVIGQSFTVSPMLNSLGVLASNGLGLKLGL